jgi:hypothetical protein
MKELKATEPDCVITVTAPKVMTPEEAGNWMKPIWVTGQDRAGYPWVVIAHGKNSRKASILVPEVILWIVSQMAEKSPGFRDALVRLVESLKVPVAKPSVWNDVPGGP